MKGGRRRFPGADAAWLLTVVGMAAGSHQYVGRIIAERWGCVPTGTVGTRGDSGDVGFLWR